MPNQRWILCSDLHCGAVTGLSYDPHGTIGKKLFERWQDCISHFGKKPDVVVMNGDGIDGTDVKGKDTRCSILDEQARDCAELLLMWGAKKEYVIVSGTPYHTGNNGEAEDNRIAHHLEMLLRANGDTKTKVTYTRKLKTTINDWFRLEMRHRIGASSVPHGRSTAMARAKFWNVITGALSSARGKAVASWPHLMVFSHVHYFGLQEDAFGTVLTTPCWQALGSRFGDEMCDGHIDCGAIQLTVGEKGTWDLQKRLYPAGMVSRWEKR